MSIAIMTNSANVFMLESSFYSHGKPISSVCSYCSNCRVTADSDWGYPIRSRVQIKQLKYSCPVCKQQSNRRYNMRVHIARRHAVDGVPIPNSDVRQLALGSQSIKDDISKFYYNSLLRRFLPISNNSGTIYPS
jgi:hypothetical protein